MLAMLADGLLVRFPHEEAYGVHNMPGLPVGRFETRTGGFMGAEDNFEIRVSGKGGHASRPHELNDAIVDLSKPFTVELNGKASEHKLDRDLTYLIEQLMRRRDPGWLWTAYLELEIPK